MTVVKTKEKRKNSDSVTREKVKKRAVYTMLYLFLGIVTLACILPFWIVMMNATRSGTEILTDGIAFVPGGYISENYAILKNYGIDVWRGFFNSLVLAISVMLVSTYFSALTAYGFYVYKFKGNKILFGIIIMFMMVPGQLSFLGFYDLVATLGLLDSYIPLIIPSIASIGTVFFLAQYAKASVNMEIVESARIDGANEMYIFHRIGVALMMPALATMGIFAFIGTWNNYMGPLLMLSTPEKFPLSLMLTQMKTSDLYQAQQGAMYLGLAISIIPILTIFISLSRYLVDSIAAGAVKG